MTIPLSNAGETVLDGKNILTYYQVKIDGVERTSKVLSYSYGFNRQFGAAQAIIVLNNDAGEFSPGGGNEIEYNDTVEIIEGFQVSGSPESWSKFYGLVRQRPVRNNRGDNTIQLTALDLICRLEDLEIDATYESANKVAVADEELTGNSIVGYANMADLWTILNDNIADEPTPILRIENRENLLVQPRVDDYDIDYETGQITMNPINKNTHKVLLTYSHYTEGLFIEDIIESILTALDGYGNSVFTTATNLTTNYTAEKGGSVDTLTPNYVTQTIDGTDYAAGRVWYHCVDEETECLTKKGWKKYDELSLEDEILTLNTETEKSEWNKINKLNIYDYDGEMCHIKGRRIDALVTDSHKFPIKFGCYVYWGDKYPNDRIELRETKNLKTGNYFIKSARMVDNKGTIYDDDFVSLVGWILTEGSYRKNVGEGGRIYLYQSEKNIEYCKEIEKILKSLKVEVRKTIDNRKCKTYCWRLKGKIVDRLLLLLPDKVLTLDFVNSLSYKQKEILFDSLVKGDGWKYKGITKGKDRFSFCSKYKGMIDSFSALCIMIDRPVKVSRNNGCYIACTLNTKYTAYVPERMLHKEKYKGKVWCPTVSNETFLVRRNGVIYYTGNSYNNISTTLVAGDYTVPGATISALSQRYGRIILNTAISTSATVTYNQNYTFKTLQASGIEVAKVSFSFKDTRSRFDAIVQLRKLCVDKDTEALTKTGWKKYNEINIGDDIYTFNMDTGMAEWAEVEHMTKYGVDENLLEMKTESFDALVIKEHKWLVKSLFNVLKERDENKIDNTCCKLDSFEKLNPSDGLIRKARFNDKNKKKRYKDSFVELVGWYVTEGHYTPPNKDRKQIRSNQSYGKITISQSERGNPENCKEIRRVLKSLNIKFGEYIDKNQGICYIFWGDYVRKLIKMFPSRALTYDFVNRLSSYQRELLMEIMVLGDGVKRQRKKHETNIFYNTNKDNVELFLYLLILNGRNGSISVKEKYTTKKGKEKICYQVIENSDDYNSVKNVKTKEKYYKGIVWCPYTKNKTFLMRRNNKVIFTGNCAPNYILQTRGTNKLWARYLNQKFTEDYILKLMSSLSYLDDQDIYTRVKLFGKNSNPTNLVTRGASMKADATEYEGYAHAQVLGYFSGYDESSSILYDITRLTENRYTDFTNWTLGGSMTRATTGYKTSPNCLYINGGASGFALSPEITLNSEAELVVISGLIKWSNTSSGGRIALWEYVDPYTSLEKAYCGIRLKEYDANHTLIRTTHQMVVGEGISQWQRLEHRFDLHSSASYIRAEFIARQGLPGYSQGVSNASVNLSGLGAAKLKVNIDGAGAQEISLTPANLTSSWKIAEEIQTKLRAIGTGGYTEATCEFLGQDISALIVNYSVQLWGTSTYSTNSYLIKSGTTGSSSSVVVTNAASDNVADDLKLGVANGGTEIVGEAGFDTITAYCDNISIIQGKDAPTNQPYEDGGAEIVFDARPYDKSELRIREDDDHPVTVYINKVPIKNQRHQIVAEKVRVIEKVTTTETSGK